MGSVSYPSEVKFEWTRSQLLSWGFCLRLPERRGRKRATSGLQFPNFLFHDQQIRQISRRSLQNVDLPATNVRCDGTRMRMIAPL